jgi:hypothetical protein
MSKYSPVIKAIASLEKKLGVKFANVDEMARAIAKERSIKADLPDVVFHGSPHAFEDFKLGEDYFRHVATDPRVAAQRIKDLNIPVEKRKFNLTSKQAKKMGFSPEDIKKGVILELRTKLGNPLTVKDKGTFSLSGLLEDPAVQKVLDPEDLKILQAKSGSIDEKWLDSEAFTVPTIKGVKDPKAELEAKKLAEALAKEEQEGIYLLGQALKKKGYDSLRYRNTAEIMPEHKELHKAYVELNNKQLEINRLLSEESDPKKIAEYNKLQKQLNKSLENLEDNFPESYALFPDTPVRHITAEMDPAKLKSNPGSLLKNIAVATGAGTAASTMMPEESEAAIVTKLDDVAKILSKLNKPSSRDMSKVLKEDAAREAYKAEFDVNPTVYHGSPNNTIKEFIPSKEGMSGPGVYTTTDPELASKYSTGEFSGKPKNLKDAAPSVYPLKVRGKLFDRENAQDVWDVLRQKNPNLPELDFSGEWWKDRVKLENYNREIKNLNYPEDIQDSKIYTGFKEKDAFGQGNNVVVFDPKNLRSPFAKFDPSMSESGDILAGLAGVGLLGGAAASSDEANAFETPEPRLMSSEKQARLEELRRKRGIK